MATTDEKTPAASKRSGNGGRSEHIEDDLAEKIGRLQQDMKDIAQSVARLADTKVGEARSAAKHEVKSVVRSGQHAVDEIQDEFGHMEKQLKDMIREKPLTAVIGAVAIGFLLAVATR